MAFNFLTGFVRDVRAAHRASTEIERMNRLNNDELATLGLQRSDISSHVFNKHFKR